MRLNRCELRGGVAGADITPPIGLPLEGHGGAGPAHSVFAPLEVRAIVFEQDETRVGIITIDALEIDAEATARIRRQVHAIAGIEPDHLLITCSHTHCAPAMNAILPVGHGSRGRSPSNGVHKTFGDWVEAQAVRTVAAASSDMHPVRLGLGCGSAHFNINRRPLPGATAEFSPNESELVDRRVRVLAVETETGMLLAVLFHFSCHPTAMKGTMGSISPDYPGVARAQIESVLGCRACFLPGCAGDIRPNILDEAGEFTSATPEQLNACGWELGNEVVRVARSIKSEPAHELSSTIAPLVLRYGPTLPREQLERFVATEQSGRDAPFAPWARAVLTLINQNAVPTSRTLEMQLLQIGPVLIVAMAGEPVQAIGYAIERRFRELAEAADCWPMGYSNGALSYFCTPRQHQQGGYEPIAYRYGVRPAAYEGEAETILETAERMLEERMVNHE